MKQNTIIGSISLFLVIVIGFFVFNSARVPALGAIADGDYIIKTSTQGNSVICAAPCVLHKIIFGREGDSVSFADSPITIGSTSMLITTSSQDSMLFDMNMVTGLTAYVTSEGGVIFVTSPR